MVPTRHWRERYRNALRQDALQKNFPIAENWDEDATLAKANLNLAASSFIVEPIFNTSAAHLDEITDEGKYTISPNGNFGYQNRVLSFGESLSLHGLGECRFDDDVSLPMLIDLKRDVQGSWFPDKVSAPERVYFGNIWMSLTPNEMISQRPGIQAANGTVLIGGLGLGWFLRKVCEKDSVERVIVVEQSKELLDWYGHSLCRRFPKVCDVVCGDVYHHLGRHGEDTIHLLDIWPTQNAVLHDPLFRSAKQRLGSRLWGWGEIE